MELLKELSDLPGVSGDEKKVTEFIRAKVSHYASEIKIDSIGNLIVFKKGKKRAQKKLVLCAHMDEVGFIIKRITDAGFLKFEAVGGLDEKVLLGERVLIGEKKIPGVIGIKAVHLQEKEERKKAPKIENLFIDIGAKDREEASALITLGDYASFSTSCGEFGEGMIKGKALDDRCGCALLIRLLKENLPFDTTFVFTVQEEVGLRGARIAANLVAPDIVIAMETTTCADFPEVKKEDYVTKMKGGPALSLLDGYTFYDRATLYQCEEIAKENDICYQYKQSSSGGNDCGAFHSALNGAKAVTISLPCRNLHSPLTVISKFDYEESYRLLRALCFSLPEGK